MVNDPSADTSQAQIRFGLTLCTRFFLYSIFFFSLSLFSQEQKEPGTQINKNTIDTLLIDRDLSNWSIRVLGNSKTQIFQLSNEDFKLTYIPNNNFGAGLGFATRKLILDMAINILDPSTDNTERFDIQGGLALKNNVFDFHLQVYDGFNIENSINNNSEFRDDIKSVAIGLDYLYLLNKGEFRQGTMRSGLTRRTGNLTSFGVGAFLEYNLMSADRSIIPDEFSDNFNEQAQLTRYTDFGGGLMLGFLGIFKLPSHFFAAVGAKAGAGLMFKNADTEEFSYQPDDPLVFKFNTSVLLGYSWPQFYTNLSFGGGIYFSQLDFDNEAFLTHLQAKLVFGYRLFKGKNK